MLINISSLTSYNQCPYAFKHDKSRAPITNTYKGDILNAVALNAKLDNEEMKSGLGFLVNNYQEYIDGSLKETAKMGEILKQMCHHMERIRMISGRQHYQEVKMIYPYDKPNDHWIVGTPDIFYKNKDEDYWTIEDFKYSTVSYYGNENVLHYDCQSRGYPFLLMHNMKLDKVKFRFMIFDKSSGKVVPTGERMITYEEAKTFLFDVVDRYLFSHERDIREPNKNNKCNFCPLKKNGMCPIWN